MKFLNAAILILTIAASAMAYYTLPIKEWINSGDDQSSSQEDISLTKFDIKKAYQKTVTKAFETKSKSSVNAKKPHRAAKKGSGAAVSKEDVPEIQSNPFAN